MNSNQSWHKNKVLVVGLGQLGLPVAKYVTERGGFDTYVYDIDTKATERAERTFGIKQAYDFGSEDFDVYIICISTHKPDDIYSPQIDGLLSVASRISKGANKDGALVSIESTIPKGTSKKVFEILNHRLHVVHAPHRWYSLDEKEHGVNQLRVIGGVCDCCLELGLQFYGGYNYDSIDSSSSSPSSDKCVSTTTNFPKEEIRICQGTYSPSVLLSSPMSSTSQVDNLGIPMHPVSTVEIAELTKVVENAHRYLQIAFAEELYLYCQANDMNFPELRDALNTKWNVQILEPREGIGGHCLPKDTKMLLESSARGKNRILKAAMEVDQGYRRYRAKLERSLKYPAVMELGQFTGDPS